jgi:predicted nucleic acid-binding protein
VDLIFDNTALSHFARAGHLDVLERIVATNRCIVPAQVITELHDGMVDHPSLASAISASWLKVVELLEVNEVVAFARFKAELGGGLAKNNGEAAVLAWTSVNGGTAVIDERAGTRIAQREGINVHGTLWLVANGIRAKELSRDEAVRIVDDLIASEMALPVDGQGFFAWAYQEGLLP